MVAVVFALSREFKYVGRTCGYRAPGEGDESFDSEFFECAYVHAHGDCDGQRHAGDLRLGRGHNSGCKQWTVLEGEG